MHAQRIDWSLTIILRRLIGPHFDLTCCGSVHIGHGLPKYTSAPAQRLRTSELTAKFSPALSAFPPPCSKTPSGRAGHGQLESKSARTPSENVQRSAQACALASNLASQVRGTAPCLARKSLWALSESVCNFEPPEVGAGGGCGAAVVEGSGLGLVVVVVDFGLVVVGLGLLVVGAATGFFVVVEVVTGGTRLVVVRRCTAAVLVLLGRDPGVRGPRDLTE